MFIQVIDSQGYKVHIRKDMIISFSYIEENDKSLERLHIYLIGKHNSTSVKGADAKKYYNKLCELLI